MNKARVNLVVGALLVFLIAIEIFQPQRTNPAAAASRSLAAHVNVPEDVQSSLMRSCGDCHSNQTRWPWYSHVAPFSWVITDDVNEGRRLEAPAGFHGIDGFDKLGRGISPTVVAPGEEGRGLH